MKRILFVVNHDITIYNIRLELVKQLLLEKYEVYISSPYGERINDLIELGCKYNNIEFSRHGLNPINEIKLLNYYERIICNINPDIVLSYSIKPNIYAGIVCSKYRISYLANITGLSKILINNNIFKYIIILFYKYSFRKVDKIFFQNVMNEKFFSKYNIAKNKHEILPGSGVNLSRNCFEEFPSAAEPCRFLFVGRLMKDKGYTEFVRMAKYISSKYKNVEFHSLGFCEEEYKEQLHELHADKYVIAHGVTRDVHEYMKRCSAVVLPSYHEGMANVLLEAAACGRPVIATDVPGCKETYDDGVSGISCKPKSVEDLIRAVEVFLSLSYEEKKAMGIAGRKKMEAQFDRQIVVDAYMKEINKIVNGR